MSNDKLPPLPSAYQYPRPYATPDGRPLFTAEQMRDYALSALEVAPAPAPLTDEQIEAVTSCLGFGQLSPITVARAIERAHGIAASKGEQA